MVNFCHCLKMLLFTPFRQINKLTYVLVKNGIGILQVFSCQMKSECLPGYVMYMLLVCICIGGLYMHWWFVYALVVCICTGGLYMHWWFVYALMFWCVDVLFNIIICCINYIFRLNCIFRLHK